MPAAYAELEQRFADLADLGNAVSILGWDQEVVMPPGGAEARAHSLAAMAGVLHERTTDPKLVKLVESLHRRRKDLSPRQRRSVELVRRQVRRATALPEALARDIALAESRGLEAWRAARSARDFKLFRPALEHMVELKRRVADTLSGRGAPYDALIDEYEPGACMADIDPLLTRLKEITVPLVRRVVAQRRKVDDAPLRKRIPVEAQRAFVGEVVTAMGIDRQRARLDLSTHPFCGGIGPGDVRMTSRYDPADLAGGLFGAIHEAGHGLYEQGLSPKRARTPLGGAISMAIHESQSRLWENMVARSRPFWDHWYPKLRKVHPGLKGVTVEAFWRAANRMAPSLIRVESDELTYNLHIILRYEIERDLFAGKLEVKQLPARWNDDMRSLLGVTPKHDGVGVLQDIHWAMGSFGYFPTYSLGNLYAAQFMEAARQDIRGLDKRLAAGDLGRLRDWLADHIHRHDQVYTAEQIARRVTGKPLGTEAFERYITAKVEALYG